MNNRTFLFPRFFRTGTLAACTALALAACAQMGPKPHFDTPQTEHLALPSGQTARVAPEWWTELNQPVLNRLLDTALTQSPDIRIAQARLDAADAQWRGTEAQAGVQVAAQASGRALYLNPKPDASAFNKDASPWLTNVMGGISASYVFDFWGRQKDLIQSAIGTREAARFQVEQARLLLAQSVVNQYTQWQLVETQLALTQKRINANRRVQNLLNQRIRAGLLAGSNAYPQAQAVLSLQAAQSQLLAERSRIEHSLAALTGQQPSALRGLRPAPLRDAPFVAVRGLRADIVGQRPDIAAQRALLKSRYFDVQAAHAAFYPNIEIQGLAGLSRIDMFDLLKSTSRLLTVAPALTLPIFDSGSLNANLHGKAAQYNAQVAQYDQTVLTALQQAADAASAYNNSRDASRLQQQAWQLARKNADAAARRERAGLENGLARWQVEDAALEAENAYTQTLAWQQQSWNNLQAALGGGFRTSDN